MKGVKSALFFLYLVGIVSLYYLGQGLSILTKILPRNETARWFLDQWTKDLWSANQVGWVGRVAVLLVGWVGVMLVYGARRNDKLKEGLLAVYARFGKKRKILYLLIALLAGCVMWYFRAGSQTVDMETWERLLYSGRWFFMSQPLGTAVMALTHRFLRELGWSPQATIQFVNCLAGVGWIFLILCLVDEARGFQKGLLLACVILASGTSLFFGYMEVTSFPLFMGLLYFYLSIRALRGGSIFWAGLACGLTMLMHGELIFLLPSLAVLVFISWRSGQKAKAAIALAWAIIPIILTLDFAFAHPQTIIGTFYGDALGGGDSKMFVSLGAEKNTILVPGFVQYSLFSGSHLLDLFNVMWITSPFALLLILPAGFYGWRTRKNPQTWFLLAFILPALLFVLLWNPDLKMLADWDLFAPPILLSMVASVFLWPAEIHFSGQKAWLAAAFGLSLVTLGLWVVRFEPQKSLNPNHFTLSQVQNHVDVNFGQAAMLLGYNLSDCCYGAGETFHVGLFWRSLQRFGPDQILKWRLISSNQGAPIAEGAITITSDNGKRPISKWFKGEVGDMTVEITLPPNTAPGVYQFWINLFGYDSENSLPIDGSNDNATLHLFDLTVKEPPIPRFQPSRRR